MIVLGLACKVRTGQPILVGVRLEQTAAGLVATQILEHRPVRHASWSAKLKLVGGEIDTLMLDNNFDAVVVKTMEARTPQGAPRLNDASRQRLQLEGVLLATAALHADIVSALSGQELGALTSSNKAGVEAEARALVGERAELIEAAAAALGGIVLVERGSA
jgi:hypothetical protein